MGRRLEMVADQRIESGSSNPAPQPRQAPRRLARPARFVAALLAVGLVSGLATYLLVANAPPGTPERTVSTQALPLPDARPSDPTPVTMARDDAEPGLQPASGPKPGVATPEPVARVADEAEAAVSGNATETMAALPVAPPQQALPMPPKPAAKPAVLAPPKIPVTPSAPSFALQLASLKSEKAAAGESARLQRQLGNALDGQAITVERATVANRGVVYRLKVGNFSSAKQAATLCKTLKEKKQSCLVVRQ